MDNIKLSAYEAAKELLETAKKGDILVVGCSSSEAVGSKIGTDSDIDTAKEIYEGIKKAVEEKECYLAAQCCEHLNRALVVEEELADKLNLTKVFARPVKKAGGSFATSAYEGAKNPCVVEFIKADFGLDIGNTLIGMHLKHVAVPKRLAVKKVGEAHVNAATTRYKYIGGERTQY